MLLYPATASTLLKTHRQCMADPLQSWGLTDLGQALPYMPLMGSRHTDPSLHGLGNCLVLIRSPSSSGPRSLPSLPLDRNKCVNVFVQPLGKQCKCLRHQIDLQKKKSTRVQFLNDSMPASLYDEVTVGRSLSSWPSLATVCRVSLGLASQKTARNPLGCPAFSK